MLGPVILWHLQHRVSTLPQAIWAFGGSILLGAIINHGTAAASPQWLLHSSRHTLGTYSKSFAVHEFMFKLADVCGTTHGECFLWDCHLDRLVLENPQRVSRRGDISVVSEEECCGMK